MEDLVEQAIRKKDNDEATYIEQIKLAISEHVKINRKHAHSIFIGPPGSGKSSLMNGLLRRKRMPFSASTGVCDAVVIVDINPSIFSFAAISPDSWEEVEYDTAILRQMNEDSFITSTPTHEVIRPESSQDMATSLPTPSATASLPDPNEEDYHFVDTEQADIAIPTGPASLTATEISNREIKETITDVIQKNGGFTKFRAFLKKGTSLYLRDAGGQVEFQEMISLLIFGPSIFFFVFRADLPFQSKYSIEYRVSEKETTNCYTSSITTEEALLQCLASVYAMDAVNKSPNDIPLVFIVGTHKDRLGPSAAEKINELNRHLDLLVKNSGFQSLVQYADSSRGQVMFAVDNTSNNDDENFKPIRSSVHSLISGREEFTIKYPISYLLFCLELQKLQQSVLSLDEFKLIAAKYRIMGEEVSHLLHFLHHGIGVIQYYDVDGLRHIVVKEPQVLFNKVTNVVIRTFSCKALKTKEVQDFQRGILTASMLKTAFSDEDKITYDEFLKLLEYLRIITPYPFSKENEEKRYFMPCVLNHVEESSEKLHTDILPLCVRFQCLHCPKGVFGVLVTHLMTPESDEDSHLISFRLIEDKIFKDQVSFEVHSHADQDELSLKIFTSHIEINFYPPLVAEERCLSIGEVCSRVREIIEKSIRKSLQNLHYNETAVQPFMCFQCGNCSELHEVKKDKVHKVYCKKLRANTRIPLQGRCWYNEGQWCNTKSRASQCRQMRDDD